MLTAVAIGELQLLVFKEDLAKERQGEAANLDVPGVLSRRQYACADGVRGSAVVDLLQCVIRRLRRCFLVLLALASFALGLGRPLRWRALGSILPFSLL